MLEAIESSLSALKNTILLNKSEVKEQPKQNDNLFSEALVDRTSTFGSGTEKLDKVVKQETSTMENGPKSRKGTVSEKTRRTPITSNARRSNVAAKPVTGARPQIARQSMRLITAAMTIQSF